MEQIVGPKSKTRKKITTIVIFLIILIAVGYLIGTEINQWWQVRKEYIKMGYASDKFPYRMYTEEELARKGIWPVESPSLNAIPTRTTPEETYAKFRQALIGGDLDTAVECFAEEKRDQIRNGLSEVLDDKELKSQMLQDLPEKIENVEIDDSTTYYDYSVIRNGEKWAQTMTFVKDWSGDWLIEDL